MPAAKSVWAIDIGQCALKALHAQLEGDNIQIDTFVTIEHERILSQPEANEPELIRTTLEKFASQHRPGKEPIVISVPGHRSFARFSKLPPVEAKKIPDIVLYEATQQIPFGIDEVVWDYQVFQSPDSPELEVGIFAIKRSLIAQYLNYFHQLNLNPTCVQTAPIALYNACVFENIVTNEASIIADVGAQNTNLLIAEGHRLWLRNIPIGGNNFTETLQKSFKLDFAKAEQLKRTAATSKYARAVFQSMRPVFSDLSAEFQRSIGFYTSVNRESHVQGLHALGNAFRLPGLLKFLQQNLGIPVKKVDTFGKLKLASGLNEPQFAENVLTFAVAYGLAIQGLQQARVTTDLMPTEIIRETFWRGKQYWFVGAAACLVLAAGAAWMRAIGIESTIENDMEKNRPAVTNIINKYQKLKSDYEAAGRVSPGKMTKVSAEKISEQRLIMPELMHVLTSAAETPFQTKLVNAKTPEDRKRIAEETPRDQREQIIISRIDLEYRSDVNSETARRGLGKPSGRQPAGDRAYPSRIEPFENIEPAGRPRSGRRTRHETPAQVQKQAEEGVLVKITGSTPYGGRVNEAARFIDRSLVNNLVKYDTGYAAKTKARFWISDVRLETCEAVGSEERPGAGRATGKTLRGGMYESELAEPSPTMIEKKTEEKDIGPLDALTGELRSADSKFTVTCLIHLGTPTVETPEKGSPPLAKGGPK